jgi:lysozyme family protein
MIIKYNGFILEKEFDQILNDIFIINESEGMWTSPNTFEWDMGEKVDNNQLESDVIDNSLDKLKKFIYKLDKTQLKSYYIKLLNKLKTLPERLRKFLITHYTSVFLTVVSLSYLVGGENYSQNNKQSIESETLDPQIKKEIETLHTNSSFEIAQSKVKEVEDGYSNDRNDDGNWVEVPGFGRRFVGTNHGISAPILQQHLGRIPKREDMENLSYQTALQIYKKDYWDAQNLSNICDQSVANIIYDGCVNQGIFGTTEVIKNASAEQGVRLSGSFYSKSNLRKLNSLDQKKLFTSIKKYRLSRYKNSRTWEVHGNGWLNRLNSFKYQNDNKS